MRTLYNILYLVLFVLSSPYYFWRLRKRGNWVDGFGQRFARYDASIKQALTNRQILWIHAVSVGEVGLCTQLINALEPLLPNMTFVVSCTTTTGMGDYRRLLPKRIIKVYYPLDLAKFVRRAVATLHPEAIILLEAEIWPNFLWRATDLKIPVFLANARLSDRSYPRYKKFANLFRPLFASFAAVGCQNEEDAKRMLGVGCQANRVKVVGNMKFDIVPLSEKRSLDVRQLLRQIGVPEDALILVAGSTHDGEEELLTGMAARLRKKFPDLFLILVPRHAERCPELAKKLKSQDVKFIFRTGIYPHTGMKPGEAECLIVNTTGELKFFYEPATVVFVGKSLTAEGGQNPIEPAALGKPVVFGPNMQNFRDIVRIFLDKNAMVQVSNADALERELGALLENASRRTELGRRAEQVVAENRGSVERTVEMILPELARRGMYIVPKNKPSPNVAP